MNIGIGFRQMREISEGRLPVPVPVRTPAGVCKPAAEWILRTQSRNGAEGAFGC